MNIGERIKLRRKEIGMSVDDLANRLGKNRATIYRYESGDIENLPMDILEPLATALNTNPQYLLGWMSDEARESGGKILAEEAKTWYDEFGLVKFTDEEYKKLVEYAKFLLSQRKD